MIETEDHRRTMRCRYVVAYWFVICLFLAGIGVTAAAVDAEVSAAMTVWTRLYVEEDASLGAGAQPYVLEDVRLATKDEPSALRLVWYQDQTDWFATWKLRLESDAGVIKTFGSDKWQEVITLATEAPIRGYEYEAALSYDSDQHIASVMVRNVTSGQHVVNEAFALDDTVSSFILSDDGIDAERIRREEKYIPVDVYWTVGVPRGNRPVRAQNFFIPDEQIAIEVNMPSGQVSGDIAISIETLGERKDVMTTAVDDIDSVILIDQDALPIGHFDLIVDYVQADDVLISETMAVSRGSLTTRLTAFEADNTTGQFHGQYELISDVDVPEHVRFTVTAALTQTMWDPAASDYMELAKEDVIVIDETLSIKAGTTAMDFSGQVPVEQEGELWHVQFQSAVDLPMRLIALPAERVVAYGPTECRLDVMSFNIRLPVASDGANAWPNRQQFVLDVLDNYAPHIVGFQEPVREQIDFLNTFLTDYDGVAVEAHRGHVHNAIYYRTDLLERLTWGSFWLSDTPGIVHSATWGNTESRAVVWARFRMRHTGQEFFVLNTHFHHVDPTGEIARRSAELIVDKIDELTDDVPVIIMGDFNSEPNSVAHNKFVKTSRIPFADAWEEAVVRRGPVNTFHGFTGQSTGKRIDWILVSDREILVQEMEHVNVRRGNVFPSDHYPVFATLCFADAN